MSQARRHGLLHTIAQRRAGKPHHSVLNMLDLDEEEKEVDSQYGPDAAVLRKKMPWFMTPPMAPPAETRPQHKPQERRDTKGTTP